MRKRSTRKAKPVENPANASGIVGAVVQDLELTAEQLEQATARAVNRLGGSKSGKARGAKSGHGRRPTDARKVVSKRRKRKP
ncbi:MAG TPA: hypothetical protein VNE82_03195 [Candidatus Binataceae bacterium]|nr:hypothetical protein [Candidatus Binataceae bacterium]HVB78938.1 hypothetical protein [Candidatus Binataceae bacterium]